MNRVVFDISNVTRVNWFGITVLEPVTIVTNLLITAVCLFAFNRLSKDEHRSPVTNLFRYFFLLMGIAMAIGGILGHGFIYATGELGKLPGWYISMFSIAFIERAAILHAKPVMKNNSGGFFSTLNYAEVALFLLLAFKTLNFKYVEAHATYGLFVVVFCFEIFMYYKKRDPGSRYIFAGTFFAAAAALVHMLKLSPNPWFNHNDLSHVIMVMGVYCYYLGALRLEIYQAGAKEQRSNLTASFARKYSTT